MPHRVAQRAEDDLDDIWLYIARESGSMEVATRTVESIASRFLLLSGAPYLGRSRDEEFGPPLRSFPTGEYLILYAVEKESVLILQIVHGRRNLKSIL